MESAVCSLNALTSVAWDRVSLSQVLHQHPSHPFQCICADFFTYKGVSYLCIADNWPIIEKTFGGAKGLIDILRRIFLA